MFKPRPAQAEVLKYRYGWMGVSAVPGSGKTHTLSALAASLIREDFIQDNQEVLVVTLVNSAVNNFTSRIEGFLEQSGLLPGVGYRVRTLHGLAHDIVRERPELAGLDTRFTIVDERESDEILRNAVRSWLHLHPEFLGEYAAENQDPFKNTRIAREWSDLVIQVAGSFIRLAKDSQVLPADIGLRLAAIQQPHPLLQMGWQIYTDYQRALAYRGAIDFDDLIRLALQVLTIDPEYLQRLRLRWPYILEDEAQDSSRLQEIILRLLSGETGNWVRVGDPNQAIFETFTTANPQYLINFINTPGVAARNLPNSGRSTLSILKLANELIDWTRDSHPNPALRQALVTPHILPTGKDDPQPNPPDQPDQIYLSSTKYQPDRELQAVAKSIAQWLPDHSDQTVAVLVPRNERGMKLVEELKGQGIPVVELLKSSTTTRRTTKNLATILRSLDEPTSIPRLVELYKALARPKSESVEVQQMVSILSEVLHKLPRSEDLLSPLPGMSWLDDLRRQNTDPGILEELEGLTVLLRRWHAAVLLPIDQLILIIGQDQFDRPADLALTHKLALVLERAADTHRDWRLPEFIEELETVSRNERRFLGFSEEDSGFDPDAYPGKVVVATVHKTKGLEWDRVYLMSVNNYDFPSGNPGDHYLSEKWFVRGKLNLEAEMLARLRALLEPEIDLPGVYIQEGIATENARQSYSAERLRLLYVAITRARKELVITTNNGQRNDCEPATALVALKEFWGNRT